MIILFQKSCTLKKKPYLCIPFLLNFIIYKQINIKIKKVFSCSYVCTCPQKTQDNQSSFLYQSVSNICRSWWCAGSQLIFVHYILAWSWPLFIASSFILIKVALLSAFRCGTCWLSWSQVCSFPIAIWSEYSPATVSPSACRSICCICKHTQ